MRLGLTSPSASQASDRRHPLAVASRSSVFCPIDVDGDSTDDAKSPASRHHDLSALSSPKRGPSVLDLSIDAAYNNGTNRRQTRAQELEYDDSEMQHSEHKDDVEWPGSSASQSPEERSTPKKPRREAFGSSRRESSSARSSPAPDELHEVISAARTSICGQMFDRCELEFGQDRVELTIWKDNKARWQGSVKYAHMVRFCFSRVNRSPYILLLELDNSRGRSEFATFYDPIFAKVCEENEAKGKATPKVYGVVFYFDEEIDYMRCQSMGDNNPKLAHLFKEKLSAVDNVVVIQNTHQDEQDTRDNSAASSPSQEEKTSDKTESRKRAATSRREDEKLKRRRIESRRNEVLLTYPYDGSDTSGRISVTLGDVDRLVPGEFLNDNIIDFYLRCISLAPFASVQQQQTYFFSSHFFTQLNGTNGAHELTKADPDERFARVARWTQKETNLFDKRFLFIPINDSFHWSVAVFCNPGSAIIKKHRKVRRRRQKLATDKKEVVDLVDGDGESQRPSDAEANGGDSAEEEVEEEEVQSCQEDRLANPPCLLFLDSLRCHRKKKFTKMLRDYLECEWKARYAASAVSVSKDEEKLDPNESIVTMFDSESIGLLEPNIPLQSNSSDCGVFLLMYAASIVHCFPAGVTREDLDNNLTSSLTPTMFRDEHVLEFREYLQQLLFSLQFLETHGISEEKVKDEELEMFTID
ncbi:hypothetical protein PInf_017243 [Phytophthora infestans]|nr:hypothetical protein PInf_017243 [Phytophthora infestans]